jgi:formamidopyrimidine-DNA glycosylase
MPELPEVETVANGVHARVAGDTIVSTWFSSKTEPFKVSRAALAEALEGRRIARVRRVGKHIVADIAEADGTVSAEWIVHLGMTGRLLVSHADVPVPPHTHAAISLASGRELRFVDARRFGRLDLRRLDGAQNGKGQNFTGPGTEPLSISEDAFIALFRGRKLAIKAALLNQSLLHGVGNIYADESLHRAGIRPSLAAGKVSKPRLRRLHGELQLVLRKAIELGGSSVSDYVDADGVRGFFQLEHRVYSRTGLPCLTCGTPIRRTIIGGRSTHSCPLCQK